MTQSCNGPKAEPLKWPRLVLLSMVLCCAVSSAATPQQIDAAVRRGRAFLVEKQNKLGNWERDQTSPGLGGAAGNADGSQWGGRTALCTYALLAAGERALDPAVARPVEWLRAADVRGNYALGLRANVWFNLPQTPANLAALKKDNQAMRGGVARPTVGPGNYDFNDPKTRQGYLFDYYAGGSRVDLSCSQYGVLGCWAAAQRLPETTADRDFWERVEAAWVSNANRDGGWAYNGFDTGTSTLAMTAAGVATLFITQELAHANDDNKPRQITNAENGRRHLEEGLKWISDNLPGQLAAPDLYAMYGIERIGVASGYKYFGPIDWFQTVADVLVRQQQPDGSWAGRFDPEIDTSFALLFLSRGRAPVMVNKLAFQLTAPRSGKTAESNWDRRPRDMANVTRWVEDKTERSLNWQIVDLDVASVDDFHDAGILYVTSDRVVSLTKEQKAKLKQYVTEGGLILFNADRGAGPDSNPAAMAASVRKLGGELFPGEAFEPITADTDSPLRRAEQFPMASQKRPVKVEGLSNGVRLLMLLVPNDDLSTTFQRRELSREGPYQFFANLFLYTTEKTVVRAKGHSHVVRPVAATQPATRPVTTVARVKYDGRWDPEPGGWTRLAAVQHNAGAAEVVVAPWPLDGKWPEGCTIAHWTGTAAVPLTGPQRVGLRAFLDAGGLLLVDAAGGRPEFEAGVRAELAKMFADAESQLTNPLPATSPLFTDAAGKFVPPQYRDYSLMSMGPLSKAYQLRGYTLKGRLAVLVSPQDLTEGLVGQPVDGIVGYAPEAATRLVRRIIELKTAGKI